MTDHCDLEQTLINCGTHGMLIVVVEDNSSSRPVGNGVTNFLFRDWVGMMQSPLLELVLFGIY